MGRYFNWIAIVIGVIMWSIIREKIIQKDSQLVKWYLLHINREAFICENVNLLDFFFFFFLVFFFFFGRRGLLTVVCNFALLKTCLYLLGSVSHQVEWLNKLKSIWRLVDLVTTKLSCVFRCLPKLSYSKTRMSQNEFKTCFNFFIFFW